MDHVKRFRALLTPLGFTPRGHRFARAVDSDFVQVVGLQSRSDPRERLYTVSLGVWSRLLARFFDEFDTDVRFVFPAADERAPDDVDCHWRQRLGFLTDAPEDLWWAIDRSPTADFNTEHALELLAIYGIPKLDAISTLDGLEQSFLAGESDSRVEALAFASVLMATRGWSPELEGVIDDLRRAIRPTPLWKELAEAHVVALERWAGDNAVG